MAQSTIAEILQERYCPPLEEALLFALVADYDLSDLTQRKQLEESLEDLKVAAIVEQEQELAPPIHNDSSQAGESRSHTTSRRKTGATDSEDNLESVTTGISDLLTAEDSGEHVEHAELPQGLEEASYADKKNWLKTLFPTIEAVQITETMAKCNGDVQGSIDELLNLSFINDEIEQQYTPPPVLKGVEGFADAAENASRTRKGKKNKRRQDKEDLYLSDGSAHSGTTTPNKWQNTAQDVEFIVSRTDMQPCSVNSIYHQNAANLASTIKALITWEAETQASKIRNDTIIQLQANELKIELGSVPDKYIYGALLLARMQPLAAKDLLEAVLSQPEIVPRSGKLVGIAQYTPINLSEDDAPKKRTIKTPGNLSSDPAILARQAGVHSIQAGRAFGQAASAYQKGKSDHLMGGAAAYYAEEGHKARKKYKELQASAADAFVNTQSTSDSVDLHGVTVEQAVRIARDRVEAWWEGLGDRKYVVGGIGYGYRIIVGLGTHSTQGIGKIGPAVSKMLMREGWRVNIQRGEVVVSGRARR